MELGTISPSPWHFCQELFPASCPLRMSSFSGDPDTWTPSWLAFGTHMAHMASQVVCFPLLRTNFHDVIPQHALGQRQSLRIGTRGKWHIWAKTTP